MVPVPEKEAVARALHRLGFRIDGGHFIYRSDEALCAIPFEETVSFDQAIRFLGSGLFQIELRQGTRAKYYVASQRLMRDRSDYQRKPLIEPG